MSWLACASAEERMKVQTIIATHLAPTARQPWRERSERVLRDPVAERPVFLQNFDEIDEHVLAPHARMLGEVVGDALVERFFLLLRPAVGHGELDQNEIVAARDAEIVAVIDEVALVVLGDDHEDVVLRDIELCDQRALDALRERLAISSGLAGANCAASERHVELL